MTAANIFRRLDLETEPGRRAVIQAADDAVAHPCELPQTVAVGRAVEKYRRHRGKPGQWHGHRCLECVLAAVRLLATTTEEV